MSLIVCWWNISILVNFVHRESHGNTFIWLFVTKYTSLYNIKLVMVSHCKCFQNSSATNVVPLLCYDRLHWRLPLSTRINDHSTVRPLATPNPVQRCLMLFVSGGKLTERLAYEGLNKTKWIMKVPNVSLKIRWINDGLLKIQVVC